MFKRQFLEAKERNKVQKVYCIQIITNRNTASVSLECRIRIDDVVKVYNSCSFYNAGITPMLTSSRTYDHVTEYDLDMHGSCGKIIIINEVTAFCYFGYFFIKKLNNQNSLAFPFFSIFFLPLFSTLQVADFFSA